MKPNEQMIKVASERLGLSSEAVCGLWTEVPGLPRVCRFVEPGRGGGALIVDERGDALWASSSVTPIQHAEAFRSGRRS